MNRITLPARVVTIEISEICNAKCRWCTTGKQNRICNSKAQFMSADVFEKGVCRLLEIGWINKNTIMELYNWGEPFLNAQLNDILSVIIKYDLKFRLSTNGSVYKKILPESIGNMELLMVSLPGMSQTSYDKIHKLDYEKVRNNILKFAADLAEFGVNDKLWFNFHVYQFNLSEIEAARHFSEELGSTFKANIAYFNDYKLFQDFLTDKISRKDLYEASTQLFLDIYSENGVNKDFQCPLWGNLCFDSEFNLIQCCRLTKNEKLGNLFDDDLDSLIKKRENYLTCQECIASGQIQIIAERGNPEWYENVFLPELKRGERNKDLLASFLSDDDKLKKLTQEKLKSRYGKVYFDCGQGLNEENSVQVIINDDNRIKHKINLPENCQSIRFDPVEGYGCLVWNLQVRCESQFLQVINHNGQTLNDVCIFRTTDPQIYLANLPVGSRWLEIEAEIICFEQAAWTKLVQEIELEQQGKIALQNEKESVMADHLLAMQQAESDKQALVQDYEQRIAENIKAYEQQIAVSAQAYEQTFQEIQQKNTEEKAEIEESFRQKLAGQNQLLSNLQRQAAKQQENLQQKLDKLAVQEQSVRQELAHYKEHYAAAISHRNDLQGQLAAAQNAYNVISNAFFWKITKPARVVMDCIKYPFRKSKTMRLLGNGMRCLKENGFGYTWNKVQQKLKHQQDYSKAVLSAYSDADLAQQRQTKFDKDIKFSILTPLYNTPENFLREMIQSVIDQTYANWELCLADGSDDKHSYVGRICRQYAKKDGRVKYKKLENNLGISANTNACIEMSVGDYIGLLDHDDLLHPAALYENMRAICGQGADFVYSDENTFHFKPEDAFCPHFKPDFSPDTLRSYNYICHFTVFDKNLLQKAGGGFRSEFDGSQDYDLILRLTEQADNIVHIPIILYYWRAHQKSVASDIGAKPYTLTAAKRALSEHLQRLGLVGEVEDSRIPSTYHIEYEIIGRPLISILIPNKDHIEDLQKCIKSIQNISIYKNWEVIVIENNSTEFETFKYYETIQNDKRIKVVNYDGIFNYSAINNFGAKFADGEYLLLLNNDIEVITPDWLEQMLMFAQRKDVGAVGSMLYYPDDTVQHAGVILGIGGVGGHAHKHFKRGDYGYMSRLAVVQNLSAVTAACMLLPRQVWDRVNGLDEGFEVAFNDVDLCMRISKAGYLIVWTPYAELYHYESKSRGYEDTLEKQKRFQGEVFRFKKRWIKELNAGDPYYNPNFTLDREDFSLR